MTLDEWAKKARIELNNHRNVVIDDGEYSEDFNDEEVITLCEEYNTLIKEVKYNRMVLVEILVYHYRKDISGCGCGWAELGRSHPEHVANIYEDCILGGK